MAGVTFDVSVSPGAALGGTAVDRPKLSISTSFDYDIPIARQVLLVAEAGFTHISLGENHEHSGYRDPARRRALKALLDKVGLGLDTIHGPRVDQVGERSLTRAIDAAAELGASVVVAHGGPFDFPSSEMAERRKALWRGCAAIEPMLEQTGVVLALENVMPGPATDVVRQALPELDPHHFGFCYDSAHDQIGGPRPFELLDALQSRVCAVHLSDRVREFVDHVPPGDGFIDWPALCQILRGSPFRGPLLLEVMVMHSCEKDATRLLRVAYERGCSLQRRIYEPT